MVNDSFCIKSLKIKNIGPFKDGFVEFATDFDKDNSPVTVITGTNGAGESIVIDALRAILSGDQLERNIVANLDDFSIDINMILNGKSTSLNTSAFSSGNIRWGDYKIIAKPMLSGYDKTDNANSWVVDYWSTLDSVDSFRINNITNIKHEKVMAGVMRGKKSNVDLVNFICHIDYLRTSDVQFEKDLGEVMYENMKKIVERCLDNEGKFKYVRRSDLSPVVEQNGVELTLDKLSSGNIFLIEHLLLLMCKMYSVCVLNKLSPERIMDTPGLLLIDEIENHLHPKWQKKILEIIRSLFPKLQIILTTHSPFVVASADGARIYTCVPHVGGNELRDETEKYSHMPVDEILVSDVFGELPFNSKISELMAQRKELLAQGKKDEAKTISNRLYEMNPEYFAYLN